MTPNLAFALYTWAVLSVVVWIVSTGLARARAFRPVRRWVLSKSDYFGEGISCQFCISHWIGFLVVGVYNPHLPGFDSTWGFYASYFGHSFAVIGAANLLARTIGKTPPNGVGHPDERESYENVTVLPVTVVDEEGEGA